MIEVLKTGQLLALPTDTVYGVVADAKNPYAVDKLYGLKARPDGKPFQVLVDSIEMAQTLAKFSPAAMRIAEKFWPGGLTLVLPYKPNAPISQTVCGALKTIGIRWPNHTLVTDIISQLGNPIAASSANVAGSMPLNSPAEIKDSFPELKVIEGKAKGTASTVVELKDGNLILYREGAISQEQLENCL